MMKGLPMKRISALGSALMLGLCLPSAMADDVKPQAAPAPKPDTQTDAVGKDVHCLYVYMAMGTSEKPEVQAAAVIGTFFWYGKLSGQVDDAQIEDRIVQVIESQSDAGFMADAQRCGMEMAQRGAAMKDLGAHLEQKGQAQELMRKPQTPTPAPEQPAPAQPAPDKL